jgi:tetratricopeptide (TPR) repeat protein
MDKLGAANLAAARRLYEEGRFSEALGYAQDAVQMLGDHARAYHRLAQIQREIGRAARTKDAVAARLSLEQARDSLQTALRMEVPLTSARLELMHDLAEVLGLDLGEKASANSWLVRAKEVLRLSPEAIRADLDKIWTPRLESLANRLK